MEKIKKMIIFCIIIIIIISIIIAILYGVNKKILNEQMDEQGNYKENHDTEYLSDTSVKLVSDKTKYYIVKDIINQFFEYVDMVKVNPSTELEKEDTEFALSALTKMFSEKYISEFKITNDKLLENIKNYINLEYNIDKMYMVEKSISINIFLVYIDIEEIDEQVSFLIITDSANGAFEIYCDEYVKKYQYHEKNELIEDINIERIDLNNFNKIKSQRVTNEDIAISYFNNYKYNILNNIEKAFNSLDKEYQEKRFGNIAEYEKYIKENIEIFKEIEVKEYLYNNYENYAEYVCKDQYDNLYIFKEESIMNYKLQLDTYTITTEKFKEEYNSASINKKVIMNIDKFIKMINNYDYKSAYNILNSSFKEKYFKTEEEFKIYMQNTYYRYNDIELGKFSDENETYIYRGTIKNKANNEEQKNMNIIMKLKSETDFEMSFEVIDN